MVLPSPVNSMVELAELPSQDDGTNGSGFSTHATPGSPGAIAQTTIALAQTYGDMMQSRHVSEANKAHITDWTGLIIVILIVIPLCCGFCTLLVKKSAIMYQLSLDSRVPPSRGQASPPSTCPELLTPDESPASIISAPQPTTSPVLPPLSEAHDSRTCPTGPSSLFST